MQTIKENITTIKIVQHSKFICKLISIETADEVKKHLNCIKKELVGANHYCYAYICDGSIRFSDDGEPSGTAGMPILNVLEKKELNHILAVVIRYFGGIKLGAGGLVRAYSNSVIEALNQTEIIELIPGKLVSLCFPYSNEKQIQYLVTDFSITNRDYQEMITYIVKIPNDKLNSVKEKIKQYCQIEIRESILIKKSL